MNTAMIVGIETAPKPAVFDASMKRLVNNNVVDVNQLMPLKYHWAWEHYKNGLANHWVPEEVSMSDDIRLWKSRDGLSEDERHMVLRTLGFFSTAESLVANNLTLAVFKHVTNAEARQYLLRQAFEEAVHSHMLVYIIESLGLSQAEVYGAYATIPSITEKDEFEMALTADILSEGFTTDTDEGLQRFLDNLIGFYIIMEGLFFYSGFAMMFYMRRHNKMKGIAEQYEYTSRDETVHLNFGIDLINGIKAENPQVWTEAFKSATLDKIKEGVRLEKAYARDVLPNGLLGLNSTQFEQYVEFIADRRLERIGLPKQYHVQNPFPWMSEATDITHEKNFFETRVTDYQKTPLSWI